ARPAAPTADARAKQRPEPAEKADRAEGSDRKSRGSIRVDLEKLDALMDLVGELILAETMVTHCPDLEGHSFERFQKAALHLNRITRSLQDVAMAARMIPIGPTFRKMLRLVRDLGQKQHKQVDLVLAGEDTEIDKTVVEAIADPLVHLIRNSVDHGIESPDLRRAAGKTAGGTIRLEARHQGGEIWIVIEDDGKGLDRDAILEKAIARGLTEPGRELRDSEIFRFIFEAGFSTAKQVTDVSGRGVGMDVVRRNIEALNGRVDIASEIGKGTAITIRLPLTLAIIEGMLVRVGESIYTFPLLAIRESIPITQDDVSVLTDGQEMVHVRGRLLPMVRLHRYHGIECEAERLEDGIVIVVEGDQTFCVWVDEIIGQRQTVIKALPAYLGHIRGVSGCSILSNGDISFILDVQSVQSQWAPHA
ncbi:MAG: chemotaxis protein CheA, partial [Myxococcales bacterium]|nr:chemotaxis protein CheA [Myxococcales bacterium]